MKAKKIQVLFICVLTTLMTSCSPNYLFVLEKREISIKKSELFACDNCRKIENLDDRIIKVIEKFYNDKNTTILYCSIFTDKKKDLEIVQFFRVSTHSATDNFLIREKEEISILAGSIDKITVTKDYLSKQGYSIKKTIKILDKIENVIETNRSNNISF